ncbi:D-lyxose/D-mannose family sugar isomerase, partial [Romboutsia ilealis]|nr:D-lyxose/D-mannose family sugar isomerase [Romboutsia ilealis]
MKRSEINKIIKNMERLIKKEGYKLPPFCNWSVSEWNAKGKEYQEIKDNMLGWDITDFGLNNFKETGFALITLRNGNQKDEKYTKP